MRIFAVTLVSFLLSADFRFAKADYCCSWNFKDCDSGPCSESEPICLGCTLHWLDPDTNAADCRQRTRRCDPALDDPNCCGNLVCIPHNGANGAGYTSHRCARSHCCSTNLADCLGGDLDDCNYSEELCAGLGICGDAHWIDRSNHVNCVPRGGDCSYDDDCCGQSMMTCQEQQDGTKSCDLPQANSPPGDYPVGDYITEATSSLRIRIPNPTTPDLDMTRTGCPHEASGLRDWRSPSLWESRQVPAAGQVVTIPENTRVVVRRTIQEELGYVIIPESSELIVGEHDSGININARGFEVRGKLTVGSETCRIEKPVTITLHGNRPNEGVVRIERYKGISVTGTLDLHGKRYFRTWTRLALTANPGDDTLMLQHPVNWEPGQEIVLITTAMKDSRDWHENEVLTVDSLHPNPPSVVGAVVHLTTAVQKKHVANNGYQAEVGLLSRTVTVQGAADDSEPNNLDPGNCRERKNWGHSGEPCPYTELTGYGGHIIVHGAGIGRVEGVHLYRMGQTNFLGRYPMHFHLLGACPDCYFRDSSIHRSYYRCISIHGTDESQVSENVAYDIIGHCFYLEDGVEQDTELSFNLAAHIHTIGPDAPWGINGDSHFPTTRVFTNSSDLLNPADVAASGFYITNVHNRVIGNAASGGWAGFHFPNLPTGLQSFRDDAFRPSSATSLEIDGNTAHSTGWWWVHASGFYFGGSLYYTGNNLNYRAGRGQDTNRDNRRPCNVNPCELGNCAQGCPEHEEAWIRITNAKTFLIPGPGLNAWSGRFEVDGYESHDTGLSMEVLSEGFWVTNMTAVCRSGDSVTLPPDARMTNMKGNGFLMYDTSQKVIITNTEFKNCGFRSSEYDQYDTSYSRGCGTSYLNGCDSSSSTLFFLSFANRFTPEVMHATKNLTFTNCGRRFSLYNEMSEFGIVYETNSGRLHTVIDEDGSLSRLNTPTLVGSGFLSSESWWRAENIARYDEQGPLWFVRRNRGFERGLASFTMTWDDALHSTAGRSACGSTSQPCAAVGYIRHLGHMFSPTHSGAGVGLPLTAVGDVVGLAGGFGWLLHLDAGAPQRIRFDEIEVKPADTPLLMSIVYPIGTTITLTAYSDGCRFDRNYECTEVFSQVDSVQLVRSGLGNTYHIDPDTGVLTFRIVQTPTDFIGVDFDGNENPDWILADYSDPGRDGEMALGRFERDGILLPKGSFGPHLVLEADCARTSGAYCTGSRAAYDPDVCDHNEYQGFEQDAYDSCASPTNPSQRFFANGGTRGGLFSNRR